MCNDGELNQDEEDWITGASHEGECGGPHCDKCPTCSDGLWNGDEDGTDCAAPGGNATAWYNYRSCPDCLCNDTEVNQFEEDWIDFTRVDECGGPNCHVCPTCFDGLQNGDETGVDCGGPECTHCGCPYFESDIHADKHGDTCIENEWCNNVSNYLTGPGNQNYTRGICEWKCLTMDAHYPGRNDMSCKVMENQMEGEYCNARGACIDCSKCYDDLRIIKSHLNGTKQADGGDCWRDTCCAGGEVPDFNGYTCTYWTHKRNRTCYDMIEIFGYDCHCACPLDEYAPPPPTTTTSPYIAELANPCLVSPCKHGTCSVVESTGEAQCTCPSGWSGKHCEVAAFKPFGDDDLFKMLEPYLKCAADMYCGYHGTDDKCEEPEDANGYSCSDYVAYGLATCAQMIEYYNYPVIGCQCECAGYSAAVVDCFGNAANGKKWWIGDGWCDAQFNCAAHKFDGGDCCEDKCQKDMISSCGSAGYACMDPGSNSCQEPTDHNGLTCQHWISKGFSCAEMVGMYGYQCPCACPTYDPAVCVEAADENGQTCAQWIKKGLECKALVADYGYDCSCSCKDKCLEARDQEGLTCAYWLKHGYTCKEMVRTYGYDCSCSCTEEYKNSGACGKWQAGHTCPADVGKWSHLSMGDTDSEACLASCSQQAGSNCCWYGLAGSGSEGHCWIAPVGKETQMTKTGTSNAALCSCKDCEKPQEKPQVPKDWQCSAAWYDNLDGCDCGCGVKDPDCENRGQDVFGCEDGETCSDKGVCEGDARSQANKCYCLGPCTSGSDGWEPWCTTRDGKKKRTGIRKNEPQFISSHVFPFLPIIYKLDSRVHLSCISFDSCTQHEKLVLCRDSYVSSTFHIFLMSN